MILISQVTSSRLVVPDTGTGLEAERIEKDGETTGTQETGTRLEKGGAEMTELAITEDGTTTEPNDNLLQILL